jgi:hypothetical protein
LEQNQKFISFTLKVTDLMKPTAIVCLMTRMAKRSLCGKSEKHYAQRSAGHQGDHGSILRLDELGVVFSRLASTTIALLLDLGECT